jgi:hypothetical protein
LIGHEAADATSDATAAEGSLMDDETRYLWGRRDAILQRAKISVLYHRKREPAFDLADRFSKANAVIGASAAFAGMGVPALVKTMAALIAVTSTTCWPTGPPPRK